MCLLSLPCSLPMVASPFPSPVELLHFHAKKIHFHPVPLPNSPPSKRYFRGPLCKEYLLAIPLLFYPRPQDHWDWQKEEVEWCSLRPLDHHYEQIQSTCSSGQEDWQEFLTPTCFLCHQDTYILVDTLLSIHDSLHLLVTHTTNNYWLIANQFLFHYPLPRECPALWRFH